MNKSNFFYIIITLIYLGCFAAILPILIYKADGNYGYTLFYIFLLFFCWACFHLLYFVLGFFLIKKWSRIKLNWSDFTKSFSYSIIGTFVILLIGSIIYSIKMEKYEKRYEVWKEQNEKREIDKFNNHIDSIKSLIEIDSSN